MALVAAQECPGGTCLISRPYIHTRPHSSAPSTTTWPILKLASHPTPRSWHLGVFNEQRSFMRLHIYAFYLFINNCPSWDYRYFFLSTIAVHEIAETWIRHSLLEPLLAFTNGLNVSKFSDKTNLRGTEKCYDGVIQRNLNSCRSPACKVVVLLYGLRGTTAQWGKETQEIMRAFPLYVSLVEINLPGKIISW